MGGPDSARPASHGKRGTPPGTSARSPNPPNGAGASAAAKKKGAEAKKKGAAEDEAADKGGAEAADRSAAEEAARSAADQAVGAAGEDDAARRSYAWRDLRPDAADRLLAADVDRDLAVMVASMASLPNYDVDLRQSILADYYFYTIIFSKENGMNSEQTSALFSIMKIIREKATDQDHTVDQSFQLFRELIIKHSVAGENSIRLFSPEISRKIIDFAKISFFQHFDLYKYCFTQERDVIESTTFCMTERPMAPLPLTYAITEEAHIEKLEQERLTRERLEREEAERIARLVAEEAAAVEMAKEAAKRRAIEQQAISAIEGTLEGLKKDVGRILDSGHKNMADKIEILESKMESKPSETPDVDGPKLKQKPTSKK